ncbi:hypothetical protein ACFODZ_07545 [Marinicella sediminis]|uniref:Uncharacterized protein n=1 Tax=Marinicella sediminis TaxID=1792834 RepID=A0ABV7J7I1_9GAMM|nr:hypothetical protein [Marinicella sediminis]
MSTLSEKQLRNLLELPNPASNRNRFSRELLVYFIERRALNSSRNARNFNMQRIEDERQSMREQRRALIEENKHIIGIGIKPKL